MGLNEIAEKIGGKILQGPGSLSFHKFNIDSRLTEPGELFFAIVARRNGHDFIPSAVKNGAAGAVISQKISLADKNFALIQVANTLKALQELARKVLAEHSVKVIGITGSTGKTTTKEFIFTLLSQKFKVLKSEGNFNNQLGVPLSLLKLKDTHEVAVLEMAMSGAGEIKILTQMAPPDIAVITNISPVHLQFFKSVDEIALAKKEILEGIKKDGTAILNGDDERVEKISEDWKGRKILFGFSERCKVRICDVPKKGWEGMSFNLRYGQRKENLSLPVLYDSYLYDFLAAVAVSYALAVPVENILDQAGACKPLSMRGSLLRLRNNIRVVDDSYNSNPKALEAALKGLADLPSPRKIAVLGDMLELGKDEVDFHFQAGRQVALSGWDILVTVGPLSQHMAEGAHSEGMRKNQIYSFQDSDKAAVQIWTLIQDNDLVLVKGSRGMTMEKIVERLKTKGL